MAAPGGHAYVRDIETAERDADIARYWTVGRTITEVAAHFGVDKSTVSRARQRAIDAAVVPAGQEAIARELIKLDAMEEAAWAVLRANHVVVSDGRVVFDPTAAETRRAGEAAPADPPKQVTLKDHKPVLMAIDRLLKIAERRARLQGLDAPDRTEITVFTADATERAIAELEAQLAENDQEAGSPRTA